MWMPPLTCDGTAGGAWRSAPQSKLTTVAAALEEGSRSSSSTNATAAAFTATTHACGASLPSALSGAPFLGIEPRFSKTCSRRHSLDFAQLLGRDDWNPANPYQGRREKFPSRF